MLMSIIQVINVPSANAGSDLTPHVTDRAVNYFN